MAASKKKRRSAGKASSMNLRRRGGKSSGVPDGSMFDSDSTGVTSLRTPAPLPPSPADSSDPGGWLEQMPTNPARIPDLGALATGGTDPGSMQAWNKQSSAPKSDKHEVVTRESPQVVVRASVSLLLLVAAACFAIGMVVGAILQSRLGTPPGPAPTVEIQK